MRIAVSPHHRRRGQLIRKRRTVYKSGGKQAAARVRYITREGQHEPVSLAERQLRYVTQAGREDLLYTRSRNLPDWAQGSPHAYFRAAEQYERANGNAFEGYPLKAGQVGVGQVR